MPILSLAWLAARLKLRHFTLLIELDRARSVSRAAEQLGLAQPTVTRSLGEIEAIFMTPLFHRSRRGLEPTPAGQLVLARARLALTDADALGQDLAALGSGLQGRLRIGVIPFLSRQTQDTLWQHVLSLRPRMGFVAEESTTDVLQKALLERRLDCAIRRFTSTGAKAGLEQQFLYDQEPRLVVSERGRAAGATWSRLGWPGCHAVDISAAAHAGARNDPQHLRLGRPGRADAVHGSLREQNPGQCAAPHGRPITILPDDIAQEVADLSGARVMPQRLQWNLPPVGMVRLRDTTHAALIGEMAAVIRRTRPAPAKLR